jgi:hypothetical protein
MRLEVASRPHPPAPPALPPRAPTLPWGVRRPRPRAAPAASPVTLEKRLYPLQVPPLTGRDFEEVATYVVLAWVRVVTVCEWVV